MQNIFGLPIFVSQYKDIFVKRIADLIGKKFPFVVNIEPRRMMGYESQGMILAADFEDTPVVFHLDEDVSNGTLIR